MGNQLFRFVVSKCLAKDKGFKHGMVNPRNFKGASFMELPLENGMNIGTEWNYWFEKRVVENGVDIRGYDPEINFVQDNTIIDGEFQDERYFSHRLDDIREWLKVEPLELLDDLCVIGFRGGEYTGFPDLFLPKTYWDTAIALKRAYNPNMTFQVHTDDPATARQFFPDFECIHDVGLNWRSVRYAKHLIIANSSFYILPGLLNEKVKEVIAPRYWARHNVSIWALPQNYYSDKRWKYI